MNWGCQDNFCDEYAKYADKQLDMVERVLGENAISANKRMYIPIMHIYPGRNYYAREPNKNTWLPWNHTSNPLQQFWSDSSTRRYLSLMKQFEKSILFNLGSHIHLAKVSAPVSENEKHMNLKMLSTPGISPVYGNHPGYTEIKLEFETKNNSFKVDKIYLNYLDLTFYNIFSSLSWTKIDLM